jgi:hypothetical protein
MPEVYEDWEAWLCNACGSSVWILPAVAVIQGVLDYAANCEWLDMYVWPRMAMLAMFILRPCRWMHRTILHRYVMSFCLVFMLVLASNWTQDMKLNGSANICQLQHFLCTSNSGICGPHAGLSLFVSACPETHNSQDEKWERTWKNLL